MQPQWQYLSCMLRQVLTIGRNGECSEKTGWCRQILDGQRTSLAALLNSSVAAWHEEEKTKARLAR